MNQKPKRNLHENLNRHRKKILAFISIIIVVTMVLGTAAQFAYYF